MRKKGFQLTSIFMMILFLLSSIYCFAGGAQESDESTISEEKTIVDFLFRAGNRTELFTRLTDVFNESQDKIQVDLVPSTGQEDLTTRIASGNNPDMTTQINGRALRPYVAAGHLMNIMDEAFIKKIRPSELAASMIDDGLYAMPMDTQAWGIFYNKKLFREAGIDGAPKTKSDFEEAVQKLIDAGITPFAVGFATPWTIGQYFGYGTSAAFTRDATKDMDAYMKGDFRFADVPEIDNIMEILDMIATNTQDKPMDSDISASYITFASEEAAMMPQGIWSILQIRELNPDIDMDIFPVPLTDNPNDTLFCTQYGFVLNIFNDTKVMDALRTYIEFYLDQDGPAGFYYDEIGVPSANATAEVKLDPACNLLSEYLSKGKTIMTYHMLMPAGFQTESFSLTIEYISEHLGNHNWMVSMLDEKFQEYTKQEISTTK